MTLAEYLEETNTTALAFAARLSVNRATISRYLSGQRLPKPEMAVKISRATRGAVTPNDLYLRAA